MSKITITGQMIVFNEGGCHPDTVRLDVGDNPNSDYWMGKFTSLGEIIRKSELGMTEGATFDDFGDVTITIEQS